MTRLDAFDVYCRGMAEDTAVEHLEQAKTMLLNQRGEIDLALRDVERALKQLKGNGSANAGAGTVREAVLDFLKPQPGMGFPVATILSEVRARGHDVQDQSLRSILTKMVQREELQNMSRGFYGIHPTYKD